METPVKVLIDRKDWNKITSDYGAMRVIFIAHLKNDKTTNKNMIDQDYPLDVMGFSTYIEVCETSKLQIKPDIVDFKNEEDVTVYIHERYFEYDFVKAYNDFRKREIDDATIHDCVLE